MLKLQAVVDVVVVLDFVAAEAEFVDDWLFQQGYRHLEFLGEGGDYVHYVGGEESGEAVGYV